MGGAMVRTTRWEKIPGVYQGAIRHHPNRKDSYPSHAARLPVPANIGRLAVEMAVLRTRRPENKWWPCSRFWPMRSTRWAGRRLQCRLLRPPSLDPFGRWRRTRTGPAKPIFIENRNSLDPKPGLQRSKDSATPWAKGLRSVNAITGGTKYTPGGWSPTPDQIDFVIGQLTGGIGREAGKVAATATRHSPEAGVAAIQDSSGRRFVAALPATRTVR